MFLEQSVHSLACFARLIRILETASKYAHSSSRKGSADNKIICTKYDPCKDLLEHLKSLEDTDIDPLKAIPEDEVSLEHVPGPTTQIILMKMRKLQLANCF